jgi:hypothetical protein
MQNQSAIYYGAYKNNNLKLIEYIEDLNNIKKDTDCTDFVLYAPLNCITRFLGRYELMKLIIDIPGAVIEMGVCSGSGLLSLIQSHNILEQTNRYREFYGFDTFEGFPSVHQNDITKNTRIKQNNIKDYYNNSYDRLQDIISINNKFTYLPINMTLIKGDVIETIPKFLDDNKHVVVSLLYLDLDLYEPTKISLKYFLPRMAKGSIIAFDEFNCKLFPGETIAVLEELGLKYKFIQILNSNLIYCRID